MGEKTAALLYETDAKVAEAASSTEMQRDSDGTVRKDEAFVNRFGSRNVKQRRIRG